MYKINADEAVANTITLGYAGENRVRAVIFDLYEWFADLGEGKPVLLVKRPEDKTPYPVDLEPLENHKFMWILTNADTQKSGKGEAQLLFLKNEQKAKEKIFKIQIFESLAENEGSVPPDPEKNWVDKVVQVGIKTEQDAIRAEQAAKKAEISVSKIGNSVNDAKAFSQKAEQSAANAGVSEKNAKTAETNAGNFVTKVETASKNAEIFANEAKKSEEQNKLNVEKSPYIGENGNWFRWDTKQQKFVDTGVKAQSGTTVITPLPVKNPKLGQLLKITKIEKGQVTELEPVEIPTSGGSGLQNDWQIISKFTLEKEAGSIEFTKTDDGKLLSDLKFTEILATVKVVGVSTNSGLWANMRVYCEPSDLPVLANQGRPATCSYTNGMAKSGVKMCGFYMMLAGNKMFFTNDTLGNLEPPISGWLNNFLDSELYGYVNKIEFEKHAPTDLYGKDSEFLILGRK